MLVSESIQVSIRITAAKCCTRTGVEQVRDETVSFLRIALRGA
jgi:hypothetical protein